jgi:glycosyltransferase involved in cell wall biosynthesis
MFNDYLELKNRNNIKYIFMSKKNEKTIIIMKLILFIALFNLLIILSLKVEIIINQMKDFKNEIIKIENYKEINDKGILLNKNKFQKILKPKISIISAVYNRGKYILRFVRSIQNQFFNDIEIIFIDDSSNDNTSDIIKKCQKEDERIILIKHKKNKGTLISRNNGALKSTGEFLMFPDPDDILANDILNYSYIKAKKKNYDMIKFNLYNGNEKDILKRIQKIKIQEIYQEKLSSFIFYGNGYLEQTDYSISNKFLKRDIFIKSLNYIDKYYLNQNMIVYEDGLINFMLYKFSQSLYHTKKIGYYYIQNQQSITKNFLQDRERTVKNCFLYLKYIFEYTKNNRYEKNMASCIYHNILLEISNINIFKYLTKEYKFYYDIVNNYLKNEFISSKDKIQLTKILKYIQIAEENKHNIKNNIL